MTNNYLIQIMADNNEVASNRNSKNIIGLFYGNYQLISCPPFVTKTVEQCYLPKISMVPFSHYSECDELTEFRLLNQKDRVIVRSADTCSTILVGYEISQRQFVIFGTIGTLLLRGPVSVFHDGQKWQTSTNHVAHSTINIIGNAAIYFSKSNSAIHIYLQSGKKTHFMVDSRGIPHRFQQKTIVQRQRGMLQKNTNAALMSLETFEYLLN